MLNIPACARRYLPSRLSVPYTRYKIPSRGCQNSQTVLRSSHSTSLNISTGTQMDTSNASLVSPKKALDYDAGPLVWIDLEMTGLNPKVDKIMEIAVHASSSFERSSLLRT